LYCPRGEHHELPLLFINYLLKKYNWGTVYLGPNIDMPVLETVAAIDGIQFIYMHLITNFTGFFIDDYLEDICRKFADKTIVASGAEVLKAQRQFRNLILLRKDNEIYDFVRKLNS
jgi:hypothetical protein